MAVLNRCAIAVAPKPPMREWSRPFWTREDMESLGEEESLYLIPTYDDEAAALVVLEKHYEPIFTAELELWCLEPGRWPAPRDYALFLDWFSLRFFPLVVDLGSEPLATYAVETSFSASLRQALG
jgi:hypothetical protein